MKDKIRKLELDMMRLANNIRQARNINEYEQAFIRYNKLNEAYIRITGRTFTFDSTTYNEK